MSQKVIGIDPGVDGGIAFYDGDKVTLFEIPTFEISTPLAKPKKLKSGLKTHKTERYISTKGLLEILVYKIGISSCKVVIEDIASFYGISASVNFKMGYNLGMIHALLDIHAEEYHLVKPSVWQKKIWIEDDKVIRHNPSAKVRQSKTDTKATSLNAAKRIFPKTNFIPEKKRKEHDGLIDAALIAHYGYNF
tara:strand:- start:7054 stop:7629 length:576 start_codon:yes stop_codon:yes gene_type:complete